MLAANWILLIHPSYGWPLFRVTLWRTQQTQMPKLATIPSLKMYGNQQPAKATAIMNAILFLYNFFLIFLTCCFIIKLYLFIVHLQQCSVVCVLKSSRLWIWHRGNQRFFKYGIGIIIFRVPAFLRPWATVKNQTVGSRCLICSEYGTVRRDAHTSQPNVKLVAQSICMFLLEHRDSTIRSCLRPHHRTMIYVSGNHTVFLKQPYIRSMSSRVLIIMPNNSIIMKNHPSFNG